MPDWWLLNSEDLPGKSKQAIVNPGVTDDSSKGYKVGSPWVNTDTDDAFICVDATDGAAVWKEIDAIAGILNNLVATTNPDADEDSGDGYSVSSRWINVTLDKEFVCLDSTPTSAIWKETTIPGSGLLDKLDATTAPTADNDTTEGYAVGSKWLDETGDAAYICVDATDGAAVWLRIGTSIFATVNITGDTLNIATQKTPASASATGTKGDIVHDTGFIYVCVATDEWERVAIATW